MAKNNDSVQFTLPSNPADKKKIRDALYEMAGIKQMIKDQREAYKGLVESLENDYQIPKKLIAKVAKIVEDHNFDTISEEHSAIEYLYEGVMTTHTAPAKQDDADTDSED